jgi:iron(III) transport system permease protein
MSFRRESLWFFTAALIIFGITSLLPLGYMLSRFIISLIQQPATITNVLIDSRQLILMGRSLQIAVSATVVALGLALPVAIILAARDLPYKRFFYFLVLVPLLIPPYVMAGSWIHLLSPAGLVNRILTSAFGPSAKLSVYSNAGCAWCLAVSFFPVIAIIIATGLSKLDSNLVDIARLSTNRWGVFRHSVLLQILPHLAASICLVMIFVLAQYGVPSLLGLNTYPVEIFAQFSAFYNDNAAFAIAVPLIVLVIFLVCLQRKIMLNHDYVRITPASETANPIMLRKFKPYAVLFLIILFIVTIVLPFLSVFAYTQSLEKILVTLRSFSDSIIITSMLALSAAVISIIIAFPIGRFLASSNTSFSRIFDILCWLPIAIPGTIIGLGLINLANNPGFIPGGDSFCLLLLCAYVGMFSAFSIRIFEASHRRTDPNVTEAAAMDCRQWHQQLWHIDRPLHLPAIAASLIVVFVLVAGELNATVLLIPPGKATLGVSIDNLLHYGANATASALCLIEAGLVIFAISFMLLVCQTTKRFVK